MKEGWTYKKLGEVCDIIGGGTPDRKNTSYYNGIIPWATVGDMNCEYLSSTDSYITEDGLRNSASRIIGRGEVIIATRVGLGKVCKLSQDTAINQDLKGVIPKKDNIDRGFLYYYFKEKARYIEANGVGATVKGVKIKFVEDLDFPLIDLKVQQRIVERLDAAFENIDKLKANAEKQLAEAQTLFQKSLAKAMEPKEGWEEKKLGEICSFSQGVQVPLNNQSLVKLGGYTRFLRIIDYTQGNEPPRYVPINDAKYWMNHEDIAIVRYGASTGFICTGLEGTLANNLFRLNIKHNVVQQFLIYVLKSDIFQSVIKVQMNGAAMPAISFGLIDGIIIPLPSLAEQQRIVERLDALSANIRKYEEIQRQIISECDALKQALLRKVFE